MTSLAYNCFPNKVRKFFYTYYKSPGIPKAYVPVITVKIGSKFSIAHSLAYAPYIIAILSCILQLQSEIKVHRKIMLTVLLLHPSAIKCWGGWEGPK